MNKGELVDAVAGSAGLSRADATKAVDGVLGAFIAGLVTSVHCVGMCGLLTCGLGIASGNDRIGGISAYHASRLTGYMILGIVTGAISDLTVVDIDSDTGKSALEEITPDSMVAPTASSPSGKATSP